MDKWYLIICLLLWLLVRLSLFPFPSPLIYYPNLKKRKFFIEVLELDYFFVLSSIMHTGLLYLSFHASYLRVSAIRIKLMQRNSHAKVTCILESFAFNFQIDPWQFWRFFHDYLQSVLHFSSQTLSNPNIRTMKADSMSRKVSDCSWQCDYSIIFFFQNFFFPLFAFWNFESCTFIWV